MIKGSQKPTEMRDSSANYQAMHYLMARAPDIESFWIPFLWNLRGVNVVGDSLFR